MLRSSSSGDSEVQKAVSQVSRVRVGSYSNREMGGSSSSVKA